MGKIKKYDSDKSPNGGLITGTVFFLVGLGFLIRQLIPGFLPKEVFTVQTLLIIIGLVSGIYNKFRGFAWLILIMIGLVFFSYDFLDQFIDIKKLIVPVFFILIGLMIVRRSKVRKEMEKPYEYQAPPEDNPDTPVKRSEMPKEPIIVTNDIPLLPPLHETEGKADFPPPGNMGFQNSGLQSSATQDAQQDADYININSYFASNERVVVSKKFKGGKMNCAFAGVVVDLHNADFEGEVVLDVFCIFGGIEIIIPNNWYVKSEVSALFGAVEDSRRNKSLIETQKVLIIKGTVMMGGLEIKH